MIKELSGLPTGVIEFEAYLAVGGEVPPVRLPVRQVRAVLLPVDDVASSQ
jgi:hypothetical protein